MGPFIFAEAGTPHSEIWALWVTAGATVGLVVGVIITLAGLWDAKRTRHGELVVELMRMWTEPAFEESLERHGVWNRKQIDELVKRIFDPGRQQRPSTNELEAWGSLVRWPNMCEAMGVLVVQRSLTERVVYRMWGGPVLTAWRAWEPGIRRLRDYDKAPDTFGYFEWLARRMQELHDLSVERNAEAAKAGAGTSGRLAGGPRVAEAAEPDTSEVSQ